MGGVGGSNPKNLLWWGMDIFLEPHIHSFISSSRILSDKFDPQHMPLYVCLCYNLDKAFCSSWKVNSPGPAISES